MTRTKKPKAIWTVAFPNQMARSSAKTKWLKSVSKKRRRDLAAYTTKRKRFLLNNPWCAWGLAQVPPQQIRSEECHHQRGRSGKLYLDERYWLPVSHKGHQFINNNPTEARKLGLLCAKGEWGKQTP